MLQTIGMPADLLASGAAHKLINRIGHSLELIYLSEGGLFGMLMIQLFGIVDSFPMISQDGFSWAIIDVECLRCLNNIKMYLFDGHIPLYDILKEQIPYIIINFAIFLFFLKTDGRLVGNLIDVIDERLC